LLSNLIVPVLNRYDLLNRMIRSIDYPVDNLIIIDNGARIRQPEDEAPTCDNPLVQNFRVVPILNNLGIAPSWNLGVKLVPFDQVFYFTSNDCVFEQGTLEKLAKESARDKVTISELWPHWQLFSVGDQVFEHCGLFDEAIFPMNFEDDEFEWRVTEMGYEVRKVDLPMVHDGQMTFKSNQHYATRNQTTYEANGLYFRTKKHERRLNAGEWSLKVRRENNW
jgi:GT2 family glycosyltransferase